MRCVIEQYGDDYLMSFSDDQMEQLLCVIRLAFFNIIYIEDVDTNQKYIWSKNLLFIIDLLVGLFVLKPAAKKFYFNSMMNDDIGHAAMITDR